MIVEKRDLPTIAALPLTIGLFLVLAFLFPPKPPLPLLPVPAARLEPKSYSLSLELAPKVIYYCDETGIPIWLACRLFSVESSPTGKVLDFRWLARARSPADALGVGQLLSSNLARFADLYNEGRKIDPFDAETSIKVAIRYLADLYAITKNWELALRCYHGGLSHFLNPGKYGPFKRESIAYARKILE